MPVYVALLRAVNVGGSGKLPMSELRELCEDSGCQRARTYIQSGNVVFETRLERGEIQQRLEAALTKRLGRRAHLHLRTVGELEGVLDRNPFTSAPPNRVIVFFLDRDVEDAVAGLRIPGSEQVVASGHEIFVHYPDGQGRSKLKIPHANVATGRNLNTVTKLLEIARSVDAEAP